MSKSNGFNIDFFKLRLTIFAINVKHLKLYNRGDRGPKK